MKKEIVERKLDNTLRAFYDVKRKIENIKHDTAYRRRLENDLITLSKEVDRLEFALYQVTA